ncbi:MAG: hybrid sensor histidine kinase/response regulator [Caldilineaceae bacterium]
MTLLTNVADQAGLAPDLGQRNLLIIDDEADILKALRRQFRRHYTIHIANSAAEGYEIMTQVPIQVIISDQRMPGMSGVEFFDRTKNEFPDAVRLLLTGYADIQSVIAAINDGNVFRYIAKPWDPEEIETIVREAFTKYEMIVENRRLLAQLQEANQRLEQRVQERTAELHAANTNLLHLNAEKDTLLGMVAHDLRGPLAMIQMCAELLHDLPPDGNEHGEFIGMIEGTARNAIYLINDLLDIAAIEAGRLVIEHQAAVVDELVARVSHLNRLVGQQKGIRLVTTVEAGLPRARLDPRRFEQVLNNLLSNAFKYSHADTTVQVRLWRHEQDLLLAVTDEGQGIAPEEISKLFKSFQRTSTRPTADEHSTGLGLAICKRIVELHGGEITVQSVVGSGTTFMVRLPDSLLPA